MQHLLQDVCAIYCTFQYLARFQDNTGTASLMTEFFIAIAVTWTLQAHLSRHCDVPYMSKCDNILASHCILWVQGKACEGELRMVARAHVRQGGSVPSSIARKAPGRGEVLQWAHGAAERGRAGPVLKAICDGSRVQTRRGLIASCALFSPLTLR